MIMIVNKKRFCASVSFLILVLILIIVLVSIPFKKSLYPMPYKSVVETLAREYSLDRYLVYAVIKTESNFKKDALSHKGAKGLMQVTDDTASWCIEKFKLSVSDDIYDEKSNITIGCAYLSYLMEHFSGELTSVIAAYNAGQGNVSKWLLDERYSNDGKTLKKIPYEETREYVKKVLKRQEIYIQMYEK